MNNFVYLALVGSISAIQLNQMKPLIHPETGLAITTSGQHWYGQPPLALAQISSESEHPGHGPEKTPKDTKKPAAAAAAGGDTKAAAGGDKKAAAGGDKKKAAPAGEEKQQASTVAAAGDEPKESADSGAKTENASNGDDEAPSDGLFPIKPAAEAFEAKEIKFDNKGYPLPEKVHTLSPELHMEYNDQSSTYLYPRTAFFAQTDIEETQKPRTANYVQFDNKDVKKDIGPTHIDPWVYKVSKMNVSPVAAGCRYEADGTMNRECNEHIAHHGGLVQVDPVTPTCTNANKATGEDQDCSAAGQSAWNTISTSRTGDSTKATTAPYPDHTLH